MKDLNKCVIFGVILVGLFISALALSCGASRDSGPDEGGLEQEFGFQLDIPWQYQLVDKGERRVGEVKYRFLSIELWSERRQTYIGSYAFFVASNQSGLTPNEWLVQQFPQFSYFFFTRDVAVNKRIAGIHLISLGKLNLADPAEVPLPSRLFFSDPSKRYMFFPAIQQDHSALLELELSESELDSRLLYGFRFDQPAPVVSEWLEPYGEACGGSYEERFGIFRGELAYSNGDCIGLGQGKYQSVEFIQRVFSQYHWTGNAEDYWYNANEQGFLTFEQGERGEGPQIGDIVYFEGGPFGHLAIIKQVAPRYLTLMEQGWQNSSAAVGRVIEIERPEDRNRIISDSPNFRVVGWLRPMLDAAEPDEDYDGDGFSVVDGDCYDLDKISYPGAPEYCDYQDNDCDGRVDEDFEPLLGDACDVSDCLWRGRVVCTPDGFGRLCAPTPYYEGGGEETCNGTDDDCDGDVDEGCLTAVCRPCDTDADCGPRNFCLTPYFEQWPFCAQACSRTPPFCPEGFSCRELYKDHWQCLPWTVSCR